MLPPDTAVVDLLIYAHNRPKAGTPGEWVGEQRLVGFVVRRDRPVQRVDLGLFQPIAEAVNVWRQDFGRTAAQQSAGGNLVKRLLWDKLEEHLAGATTVLISPDGALAQFPFAALPGKEPGKFLIEERAVGVIPVPQLLALILDQTDQPAKPSLLLVGDVDFNAAPGSPQLTGMNRSAPGDVRRKWAQLKATKDEASAIKKSFESRFAVTDVTELVGRASTEDAVRTNASQHRYLHFATHGFFAPAQLRSALSATSDPHFEATRSFSPLNLTGLNPGLLSGLVLSGANQRIVPGQDDGILTALEVADLDLNRVELATLSACETGLGEVAGGEGLLSLQRAFQVAGARTVVAGLWKVPDRATQELMTRFYENLWRKNMSKLEAMRQAQLWMLREASKDPETLRGLVRGVEFFEERPPRPHEKLPPYFWSAFVVSGDWR